MLKIWIHVRSFRNVCIKFASFFGNFDDGVGMVGWDASHNLLKLQRLNAILNRFFCKSESRAANEPTLQTHGRSDYDLKCMMSFAYYESGR